MYCLDTEEDVLSLIFDAFAITSSLDCLVKEKSLLKPWVSENLIRRIKIRDNLARKYNKGKIARDTYTRFRNKLLLSSELLNLTILNLNLQKVMAMVRKLGQL